MFEGQPPREVSGEKTVAMQLQRMWPCTDVQQQFFGRGGQLRDGGVKGLPFKRVFVGFDQEGLGDTGQGFGQLACNQLIGPALLLFGSQPFFLDGSQCGLQDLGGAGR